VAAPITGLTPSKIGKAWLVPIQPTARNGLTKDSGVDVLQVRGLSVRRFVKLKGRVRDEDMSEIVAALAIAVEYARRRDPSHRGEGGTNRRIRRVRRTEVGGWPSADVPDGRGPTPRLNMPSVQQFDQDNRLPSD
jgi:hypothetical protein